MEIAEPSTPRTHNAGQLRPSPDFETSRPDVFGDDAGRFIHADTLSLRREDGNTYHGYYFKGQV